jgi:hypothetical protein
VCTHHLTEPKLTRPPLSVPGTGVLSLLASSGASPDAPQSYPLCSSDKPLLSSRSGGLNSDDPRSLNVLGQVVNTGSDTTGIPALLTAVATILPGMPLSRTSVALPLSSVAASPRTAPAEVMKNSTQTHGRGMGLPTSSAGVAVSFSALPTRAVFCAADSASDVKSAVLGSLPGRGAAVVSPAQVITRSWDV